MAKFNISLLNIYFIFEYSKRFIIFLHKISLFEKLSFEILNMSENNTYNQCGSCQGFFKLKQNALVVITPIPPNLNLLP